MAKKNKKQGKGKIRTEFRKNREVRVRKGDLTREFHDGDRFDDARKTERVSGKGTLSRKRTIVGVDAGRVVGVSPSVWCSRAAEEHAATGRRDQGDSRC